MKRHGKIFSISAYFSYSETSLWINFENSKIRPFENVSLLFKKFTFCPFKNLSYLGPHLFLVRGSREGRAYTRTNNMIFYKPLCPPIKQGMFDSLLYISLINFLNLNILYTWFSHIPCLINFYNITYKCQPIWHGILESMFNFIIYYIYIWYLDFQFHVH